MLFRCHTLALNKLDGADVSGGVMECLVHHAERAYTIQPDRPPSPIFSWNVYDL